MTWSAQARVRTVFHDVGALVLFLRMVPWQAPAFDAVRHGHRLRALHERMAGGRPLTAHAHRFALPARRSPGAGARRDDDGVAGSG
ncbi:hypothetical protein [Nonomuraea sp. NPDC052265]|uniref:hypothetical protein n=1 Tax=Nonomuraea sp. NPDC052265 TaxID=3364374 RepID=UPI0037CB0CDE